MPDLLVSIRDRFNAVPAIGSHELVGWSLGGSYAAFIARCKRGGYAGGPKRAAFWRALGFPNLVRARAAKARKREERLKRETLELARRANPFALPEDSELWASVAKRNVRGHGHKEDSLSLQRKKTPDRY